MIVQMLRQGRHDEEQFRVFSTTWHNATEKIQKPWGQRELLFWKLTWNIVGLNGSFTGISRTAMLLRGTQKVQKTRTTGRAEKIWLRKARHWMISVPKRRFSLKNTMNVIPGNNRAVKKGAISTVILPLLNSRSLILWLPNIQPRHQFCQESAVSNRERVQRSKIRFPHCEQGLNHVDIK